MKILIQGGRVIDPSSNTDTVADVAISAGKIVAIGKVPADFQAQKNYRRQRPPCDARLGGPVGASQRAWP